MANKVLAIRDKRNYNRWLFVSKVCRKTIKFCSAHDSIKLAIPEEDINKLVSRIIAHGYYGDFCVLDYNETRLNFEQLWNPTVKVKEGSSTAKKFNIKPDNILRFASDIVYVYACNAHEVTRLIKLSDIDEDDYHNMFFAWDNFTAKAMTMKSYSIYYDLFIKYTKYKDSYLTISIVDRAMLDIIKQNSVYPDGSAIVK